jgi:DNA mismatch endonuclease (patch repair protein)
MRANKGRDTAPELAVRRAVHRLGLRYRVGVRPEPTLRRTADLVFTRRRVAVFVDGCFWHGCPEHHTVAKRNGEFWARKVADNIARDRQTTQLLQAAGWTVLRYWEHEPPEQVAAAIAAIVRGRTEARHNGTPGPEPTGAHGSRQSM